MGTGLGLARRKGSPDCRAASIVPRVIDSTDPEEPQEAAAEPAGQTMSPPPPMRRWRRIRVKGPTQEELDALPVKERLELLDRRRQGRHQTLNSIGILFGVVFTAGSLVATALSVRTTQNELRNGQQGQITDRYTKAVDQLGSTKLDIRLGGIYALERLAHDSARDNRTVYDVLTAFVREHAPNPGARIPDSLATDVQAALTVIGRRENRRDSFTADLSGVHMDTANLTSAHLYGANLTNAHLIGANLADANLTFVKLHGADLTGADLLGANLHGANPTAGIDASHITLTHANLQNANLTGASLAAADLSHAILGGANLTNAILLSASLTHVNLSLANLRATNLAGANLGHAYLDSAHLIGADLTGADLTTADLTVANLTRANLTRATLAGADLSRANLTGANLTGANLRGADLSGADLRGILGITTDEIRKQARTNPATRF